MNSQMKVTSSSLEGHRVSAPTDMQYPITPVLFPGRKSTDRGLRDNLETKQQPSQYMDMFTNPKALGRHLVA